jgi:hypothetical protein
MTSASDRLVASRLLLYDAPSCVIMGSSSVGLLIHPTPWKGILGILEALDWSGLATSRGDHHQTAHSIS